MGVDIGTLFERQQTSLNELRPGIYAVDANNALYQFLTIIRQPDGTPLMDSKGRITSHLCGLFYRTCALLEKGIIATYVFDGKPHQLKLRTLEARERAKRKAREEYERALREGRIEELKGLAERFTYLSDAMIEESKQLLSHLGLPWIQAPGEGEAQCAALCKAKLVEATCSQDFDALLFGSPTLIRNLAISRRRKIPRRKAYTEVLPERIDLGANLRRLGINQRQLVWIGILVGTDFNEGVYGIGAKKALKLIKAHKNFDEILDTLGVAIDYKILEEIFLEPEVATIDAKELAIKAMDKESIIDFMCEQRGFSRERIEGSLSRAEKGMAQKKLAKWF